MSDDEMTTQPTILTVLERLDEMRAEIKDRFDTMQAEVAQVNGRLDKIEAEMNARFDAMQAEMNARFDVVEQEFKAVRADIRRLDRGFDKLAGEFARIRIVHDEIEERIDKIENQPA